MAIVGGDILDVGVAGVHFAVASGSAGKLTLGGYKPTTRRMGGGSTIITGERFDWSMTDVDLAIDASSNQLDYLQSVANALAFVAITIAGGYGRNIDDTVRIHTETARIASFAAAPELAR